ncbi:hypothetical protein E1287_17040 [Actinomadura sp. KC06]|uniref:hypothetical protein n=1 Tax=Actinomadura sp. KC06 TaxID=2530369 RepID=UPI001050A5D2|nr:hypothetical protein [Actinomadura sp. KC06]TDD34322.1 hypothetical protein E1287_17040 [Actinomadura sp. KC06]
MGRQPLSCPFFLAVGLRPRPDESEAELRALAGFYDTVHLAEVVRLNEGFVSGARYELTEPLDDDTVPSWLAVYGIDGEDSARAFVSRQRPVYTPGPPAFYRAAVVWRMIWESAGSVGAPELTPGKMAMVGMNPAADATDIEIAAFDDFYTRTHLPEIVSGLGYDRGTRFLLWHEFTHPAPGCPRYNAVYEAEDPEPRPPGVPPLTPGPRAWEERQVGWRAKYRRAA